MGEFAGATFDYHADHPELGRPLQWEGLRGGPAADVVGRTTHHREKVARFAEAQGEGALDASLGPGHLVFAMIALAARWQTAPDVRLHWAGAGAERASRDLDRDLNAGPKDTQVRLELRLDQSVQ